MKNDKTVIIINGKAGVGKDTFVNIFSQLLNSYYKGNGSGFYYKAPSGDIPIELEIIPVVENVSSVDGLKDIATKYFNYDNNNKTDKDRKFLADLKQLTTDYCDYSHNYIINEYNKFIDHPYPKYLFIHIREPKEIERLKTELNAITLQITSTRTDIHKVDNNASDRDTDLYDYDFSIANDGTIEEFTENIKSFIRVLGNEDF